MEDKLIEILALLVQIVKDTAPEIWRIALRQVYAEIAQDFMVFLAGAFIVFLGSILNKKYKEHKLSDKREENKEELIIGAVLLSIIGFLCCIFSIHTLIPQLINPEYYAIKVIFNMLP